PSADAVNGAVLLQRFNPLTRFLEPAEWPASLSAIRGQLSQTPPAGSGAATTIVMRSMVSPVWPAIPALVIPTPMVMLSHLGGRAGDVSSPLHMSPEVHYTVL